MAIKCPHCGQALPRVNARFCNSCGTALHLEPPAWMSTLEREARTDQPSEKDNAQVSNPPDRVLRVKIWENKGPGDSSFSEEDTIFPEDSFENLPTAQLEVNTPKPPALRTPGTAAWGGVNQAPIRKDSPFDDVTQLSTSRLPSQKQVKPEEPMRPPWQPPMQRGGAGPTFQRPPMSPQPQPRPPFQAMPPAQDAWRGSLIQRPPAAVSIVTKPVSRERRSYKRLGIVLVLLFIVIAGGIVSWIIAFQPFEVASITQPWQQFCDVGLGVSGRYPTGWMKQVDQKKAVRFSDGTDQFNISTVVANGQDAGKYLQQEASQLGITGLKVGSPLSFAGASWQQAQGSQVQSQPGVTYSETLLVTVHGDHLFTIMQIAPPGTFSEEDKAIFSGMRSAFQFSNSCL